MWLGTLIRWRYNSGHVVDSNRAIVLATHNWPLGAGELLRSAAFSFLLSGLPPVLPCVCWVTYLVCRAFVTADLRTPADAWSHARPTDSSPGTLNHPTTISSRVVLSVSSRSAFASASSPSIAPT
jgi:hypothetical protein